MSKQSKPSLKRSPHIRFSEFADDWHSSTLNDLLEQVVDNRGKTPPVKTEGVYLIEANALGKKEINYSVIKKYVDDQTFRVWFRKHIQKGDVLFTTVGSTGTCSYYDGDKPAAIAQNIVGLRANINNSKEFLYYLLTQPSNSNKFKAIEMVAVQPSVKVSQMIHLSFAIPKKQEQDKIADFLNSIDDKISVVQQKILTLILYKKGTLEAILTQKIHFKDSKGELFPAWKEKTFGELLDYEQPTKYIVKSTEYNDQYDMPVLTAGKTFILGYTNESTGVFDHMLPVIIFDDFTTSSQFVNFPFKVKSSAMKILKAKPGVSIEVVYEMMARVKFSAEDHRRYWISEFQELTVRLPSESEQKIIADYISAIDEKINLESMKLNKAIQLKQALLQGMFV
jgi:type I restriction enzyme S subunit